ncbi:alpha/beta hydrolase family protein [Ekhidna sp.]
MELFLNEKLGKITLEINEADSSKAVLIIAHGAGAGMHHPFMTSISKLLSEKSITTARFNFPYMEQGRKSPGSPKSNIETWRLVLEHIMQRYQDAPIFLSGKSYGGRMASHLVVENNLPYVKGIIYFGFPLHAPGKDSIDRAANLVNIKIPQLFLQGSNDKLANLSMMEQVVSGLKLASIETIAHADHSFNVPKKSGKTKEDVLEFLAECSATWIRK